ncbi:MAG: TadE/TadG family protein [Phyllobacteriaceae bacterium]|nr:TadE/TadG family protein [Phyllobacteriaceae bacterium]
MSTTISSTIRRFADDRSGNFALATASAIVVVLMAVGTALNVGAMVSAKSRIRNALDAALTSTARDLTTGKVAEKDARAAVERFLSANQGNGFGGDIRLDTLTVDRTAKTLTGNATVQTPIVFPMFSGVAPDRLGVESAAAYSDTKIEVSMVLDVTGSMKGTKIADLRTAAKNAVGLFLDGQDPKDPRVRIALVPYATAVNTGSLANTVYIETKGGSDVPPGLSDPRLVVAAPDNCATERKVKSGVMDFSDNGPETAMVNRDDRLGFCPSAALMPLTADKKALAGRIDSFIVNGATAGHIGIQWGRYLLSPKWKDVLPTSARPAGYKDKAIAKYAIIMTDGEFNTAFVGDKGAGASSGSAVTLCDAMQDDGVEVFTIGFMLTEANAKATMKACASADTGRVRHHYEAADGAALDAAFKEIAANIEKLAITK